MVMDAGGWARVGVTRVLPGFPIFLSFRVLFNHRGLRSWAETPLHLRKAAYQFVLPTQASGKCIVDEIHKLTFGVSYSTFYAFVEVFVFCLSCFALDTHAAQRRMTSTMATMVRWCATYLWKP